MVEQQGLSEKKYIGINLMLKGAKTLIAKNNICGPIRHAKHYFTAPKLYGISAEPALATHCYSVLET